MSEHHRGRAKSVRSKASTSTNQPEGLQRADSGGAGGIPSQPVSYSFSFLFLLWRLISRVAHLSIYFLTYLKFFGSMCMI